MGKHHTYMTFFTTVTCDLSAAKASTYGEIGERHKPSTNTFTLASFILYLVKDSTWPTEVLRLQDGFFLAYVF
jgi:hypothetical protein